MHVSFNQTKRKLNGSEQGRFDVVVGFLPCCLNSNEASITKRSVCSFVSNRTTQMKEAKCPAKQEDNSLQEENRR